MFEPVYDPLAQSELASAAIAIIPILLLFVMLAFFRVIYAGLAALAGTLLVAIFLYKMPVGMAFLSALNGALFAIWPVIIIILGAIYLFDASVLTSHLEAVKYAVSSVTRDKRLLSLLISYCFSGLLEGASGFSTPIALSAAMLVGVGLSPFESARSALLANTIPVAYGAVGTPVLTLASTVGIPAKTIGIAVARMLIPFSLTMPAVVTYAVCEPGWKGVKQLMEVWPPVVMVGIVQTGVSLLVNEVVGPESATLLSFLVSLLALAIFLRFWSPKNLLVPGQESEQKDKGEEDVLQAIEEAKEDVPEIVKDRTVNENVRKTTLAVRHMSFRIHRHPSMYIRRRGADSQSLGDILPSDIQAYRKIDGDTRKLDSSSLATALFPHTLDHRYMKKTSRQLVSMRERVTDPPDVRDSPNTVVSEDVTDTRETPETGEVTEANKGELEEIVTVDSPDDLHKEVSKAAEPPAEGGDDIFGKKVVYDVYFPPTKETLIRACIPWVLIPIGLTIWGSPPVKKGLSFATVHVPIRGLDNEVLKNPTVEGGSPTLVRFQWTLDFLSFVGTCLWILTVFCIFAVYRVSPRNSAIILWRTVKRMALSLVTICVLLAFGYVLKASGQDVTLGLAATKTKGFFPFLSAVIGFLGVALTGSATTCSVIFGSLQVVAAQALAINPVQAAANCISGGAIGHIISTSSMVVASVATGEGGKSIGPIMKSVLGFAVVGLIVHGCWNLMVTNLFPGFVPYAEPVV